MDDYLEKPIQTERLDAILSRYAPAEELVICPQGEPLIPEQTLIELAAS